MKKVNRKHKVLVEFKRLMLGALNMFVTIPMHWTRSDSVSQQSYDILVQSATIGG